MGTATFIKDVSAEFTEMAGVYQLDPPLKDYEDEEAFEFVVVSAISCAFDHGGSETLIFPSSVDGDILDWGELPGSQRGTMDAAAVLATAGYDTIA